MSYSADLMTGFLTRKNFSIDEESIIYDDTQMMCNEVTGFAYGSVETYTGIIKANTEYFYHFVDSSGDEIKFSYVNTALVSPNPSEAPERIAEKIWKCFGNRLVEDMIVKLGKGTIVTADDIHLSKYGITIPHKPFFGAATEFLVPWEVLETKTEDGLLTLRSGEESKAKITLVFHRSLHAHLLKELFNRISNEPEALSRIKGKKL